MSHFGLYPPYLIQLLLFLDISTGIATKKIKKVANFIYIHISEA